MFRHGGVLQGAESGKNLYYGGTTDGSGDMGLKDQLTGRLPADLLPQVSDRFDVIGNIAVIALPPGLRPYGKEIARTIVARRKNIVTVVAKRSKIAGDSRTALIDILWGDTTVTMHREYGLSFRLDVRTAFFSPRLASERKRVSGQVLPGERVYVPFAGVGPFAIPAAARGAEVYAAENNPDALRWLQENVSLNHLTGTCHVIGVDALDIRSLRLPPIDRLIIPAPYGMDHALDILLPTLSPGGIVHFYTFRPREEIGGLIRAFGTLGLEVRYHAPCGNVAPGISRWVFDMSRTR